jgi:hypothetical protein
MLDITPTLEVTPLPEPTATPSALLDLKWNMMTVKSPLTAFSDYKIYYPTTWTIKEYKNTPGTNDSGFSSLVLSKDGITMTIDQNEFGGDVCLYSGDAVMEGSIVRFSDYKEISQQPYVWRWGQVESVNSPYGVCELSADTKYSTLTAIGRVMLNGTTVDESTLEEFNYILEKIVILK